MQHDKPEDDVSVEQAKEIVAEGIELASQVHVAFHELMADLGADPRVIITAFMVMSLVETIKAAKDGTDLAKHRLQAVRAYDVLSEIVWTKDPLRSWAVLNSKIGSLHDVERGAHDN